MLTKQIPEDFLVEEITKAEKRSIRAQGYTNE